MQHQAVNQSNQINQFMKSSRKQNNATNQACEQQSLQHMQRV